MTPNLSTRFVVDDLVIDEDHTTPLGEDNILYASDYPHWDSEWPHTVDELLKRGDLSQPVKAKILGGNALRFYDLKAPSGRRS